MSTLSDPYVQGIASGWRVIDSTKLENDTTEVFDFVIIGSGAGGATAAKTLAAAGHRVAILEEGALVTSREFNLREKDAYLKLYQEGLTRVASQGAISIMQGRTVGGSTTVNWASSFRTPTPTLEFWQNEHGVQGLGEADLRPIFDRIENDLGIAPWTNHNENNSVLRDGCERLGIPWHPIPRNVKGCWNLGYCGMGCPTNAKQSMLVSHIPSALKDGATLFHGLKARQLQWSGDKVSAVECVFLGEKVRKVIVRGKNFILSAGAIGTPGILLRSTVPDPYHLVGKRTFLHVTIFSFAQSDSLTNPFHGAPQSIYSDHFQWKDGPRGPMGFKLESAPLHPIFTAALMPGVGNDHYQAMEKLPHTSTIIALMRDGFHDDSPGGTVSIDGKGNESIDYPITPYVQEGLTRALTTMAEIQFAAGCKQVTPAHGDAKPYKNLAEAKREIQGLSMEIHRPKLGSAHVMGGCPMGGDPKRSVVDNTGRHRHLANLHVFDASIFPTSLGTNPQLTIFGVVTKLTENLLRS